MNEKEFLTQNGYDKLTAEIKDLKENQRPHTVEELDIARSHGDLKENAEYHAAKEKLAFIDGRINELGVYLGKLQIVDPSSFEHDIVRFGSSVTLLDLDTDNEVTYIIVGAYESVPEKGIISIKTPLAKALMGKEEGDEVTVRLPAGEKDYEVVKVFYKEF